MLLAALALLLVSTANSNAQNLLFSDGFSDPNLPGWAPEPGKIAVVDQQLVLSTVYPAFNPNDILATHLATWHAIPVSGPLADHETMEFRVDWVGPHQEGLCAGIHALWYDPPQAHGYTFFVGEGEAIFAKYWDNVTSFACFFNEDALLGSEELTLVLTLTRHGDNVDITSRILDKANGGAILFEKTVTDTPGSDPVLPEGVHGVGVGGTDPAGEAWPIQQAPTEIDLTLQWFGNDEAAVQVVFDNAEVWQYALPALECKRAVMLSWPETSALFSLEWAGDPAGPWEPVLNPWVRTYEQQVQAAVLTTEECQFYRLSFKP